MQPSVEWNDLRYFLAVLREGNLVRAASRLGIDPTTVGRRVSALEERIGARLFDRTPEGWIATPAGRRLEPSAARMEDAAAAAEREIAGADARPEGVVLVTATEMLATRFLAPHLGRFATKHPGIELHLLCTNKLLNLGRREADVSLRLSRPKEENVVAKKLTTIPLALYASSAYLDEVGRPADPEKSLAGHRVLLFSESRAFESENRWMLERMSDARVVLRSDSVSSVMSAAVGGLGIALLPRVVGDAEPRLERVVTRSAPAEREIWQSVHRDLARNARIRAVTEFLGKVLGPVDSPRGKRRG
ncbi:MAG: LysR family transcriptional regulator [Deltaproteobacteria bacterium]|nr:LysR family transcriptional regulator [Deltaproteobacteria bacterium]